MKKKYIHLQNATNFSPLWKNFFWCLVALSFDGECNLKAQKNNDEIQS